MNRNIQFRVDRAIYKGTNSRDPYINVVSRFLIQNKKNFRNRFVFPKIDNLQ